MKNNAGFTLIELIMVIVVLSVLSAIALPRFANFGNNARESVLSGTAASVASAANLAHSLALVAYPQNGTLYPTEQVIIMEGVEIIMNPSGNRFYPAGGNNAPQGILAAANLRSNDYTVTPTGINNDAIVTIGIRNAGATCEFNYNPVDGSVALNPANSC